MTSALEGGGWSKSPPGHLYPRERPGTHCTGGWVGPRAGLDRCGKSRPHRDWIPGPSRPQRVAIPTELSSKIIMLNKQRGILFVIIKINVRVPSVVYSTLCDTISQHSVSDLVFLFFFLSYFIYFSGLTR
jgi:hypothetical protein